MTYYVINKYDSKGRLISSERAIDGKGNDLIDEGVLAEQVSSDVEKLAADSSEDAKDADSSEDAKDARVEVVEVAIDAVEAEPMPDSHTSHICINVVRYNDDGSQSCALSYGVNEKGGSEKR